jgi:hypothetical protein
MDSCSLLRVLDAFGVVVQVVVAVQRNSNFAPPMLKDTCTATTICSLSFRGYLFMLVADELLAPLLD